MDAEGECVDYAGDHDAFTIRVTAAHLRVVFDDVASRSVGAGLRFILVRTIRYTYAVRRLPEGYALCIEFGRRAGFVTPSRAISGAAYALSLEAGWEADDAAAPWTPVSVHCEAQGRPVRIQSADGTFDVEVLGRWQGHGLAPGERGFRVRLANGIETTLVRERSHRWFAEGWLSTHPTA
ncbi:MAG: hypothetical protein U0169_01315 [Polyangiaceae bacterium]